MNGKLAFALLIALVMGVTFMNVASSMGVLMELYAASFTMLSMLMGALFWTHALSQIPAGILVDRLGLGRVLVASLAFTAAGNLIAAWQPSAALAVTGRIIAGLGTGFGFPAIFKMLGIYAPPNRVGAQQASFGAVFALGCIVAYLWLPLLVEQNWRWAYLFPGLAGLPLVAMGAFMDFSRGAPQRTGAQSLGSISRNPIAWTTGIYHGLSWGVVLAVGSWLPALLAEVTASGDSANFAWSGALLMLVSGSSRLAGAALLRRMRPDLIANCSLALNALLFAWLFFASQPWAVLALCLLTTFFASVNFGALFQIATQAGPRSSMATFLGFVNLLANLGGLINTMIFGWFKDQLGTFGAGFVPLAVFCLLAVLLGRRQLSGGSGKGRADQA